MIIIVLLIVNICTVAFLSRYMYRDLRRRSKAVEEKNSELLKMYESIEGFMNTFYTETNALKAEVAEVRANIDDVRLRTASQVKDVFYTETNALKAELTLLKNNAEEVRPRTISQVKDMLYSETDALRAELAEVRAGADAACERVAAQLRDALYAGIDALRSEVALLREDAEELRTRTVPQDKKERAKRGRPRAVREENEPQPGARDAGETGEGGPGTEEAAGAVSAGAPGGETRIDGVMRMHREGKSRQDIAKEMNMTKNEVDLIINLREIMPSGG
ncbi:MAG: hypothetical protein LBS51_02190 [Oscillospiraceae bacterium]|nr:hypothetical protein [Oscillospiraceae bacterium]